MIIVSRLAALSEKISTPGARGCYIIIINRLAELGANINHPSRLD